MSQGISVGVFLPTFVSGSSTGRTVSTFARHAEQLGFDSLWATDHLLHSSLFYQVPWLEPLTALTYAAQATERVGLGTSVLVTPIRHPVILAKQIATLQAVSGDRFILGVGTGWDEREFQAIGIEKKERGARTDECIAIIDDLLAGKSVTRPLGQPNGFYELDGVKVGPTPSRRTQIWTAGGRQLVHDRSPEQPLMAPRVLDRIARCDGWIARPTSSPEQIQADVIDIRGHLGAVGRDPGALTLAHENFLHLVDSRDPDRVRSEQVERFTAVMGEGRPFSYFEQVYLTGTTSEVIDKINARLATGVTHLLLHTLVPSVTQLDLWAEHVLPHLRGAPS